MGVEWDMACVGCRSFAWLGSMKPFKWGGFQVGNACFTELLSLHAGPNCGLIVTSDALAFDARHALETAADIVNNAHDLDLPTAKNAGLAGLGGAKIKLVFADHQGDPQKGRAEAERLMRLSVRLAREATDAAFPAGGGRSAAFNRPGRRS